LIETTGHQAPFALGVEVGQQDRERFAHDPAAVHGDSERAKRETGAFQVEQLAPGQIDGDLLGVAFPAACLTLGLDRRTPAGGTEQFGDSRQAYPP
jgi:hypothetical protein